MDGDILRVGTSSNSELNSFILRINLKQLTFLHLFQLSLLHRYIFKPCNYHILNRPSGLFSVQSTWCYRLQLTEMGKSANSPSPNSKLIHSSSRKFPVGIMCPRRKYLHTSHNNKHGACTNSRYASQLRLFPWYSPRNIIWLTNQ
jgi:hypothetical protein